jgi:hypothetical protein
MLVLGTASHRGTPMSLRAWPLPASSTTPRSAWGAIDCASARSRAIWARAMPGTASGGQQVAMPRLDRLFLRTDELVGRIRRRGRSRDLHGVGSPQVRRHDGKVVFERDRDEGLVHRPVPACGAACLRDEVVDVARRSRRAWSIAACALPSNCSNAIAGRAPDCTIARNACARSACCAALSCTSPSSTTREARIAPASASGVAGRRVAACACNANEVTRNTAAMGLTEWFLCPRVPL